MANTFLVNPYGKTYPGFTNALLYANPSGMIITAQERHASPFGTNYAAIRAGGGEVLAYIDAVDYYTSPGVGDAAVLYPVAEPAAGTYLWPSQNFGGPAYGTRTEFPGSLLADLTAGSAWSNYVVAYVKAIMLEGLMDGVYLDVVGGQLYTTGVNGANWDTWSSAEQDAWTNGNVDLVRRIDALRRAINPNFIVVNNNVWDRVDGSALGHVAEQYVDGVELEHPPINAYHIAYVAKTTFSNLGHRRMLVTANTTADALTWAATQGVTTVDDQTTPQYTHPNVPSTTFNALSDRNLSIPSQPSSIVSGGHWVPFRHASRLRSLQQGSLNVGNTQQNLVNLKALALAQIAAPSSSPWAMISGAVNMPKKILIWPQRVPGYVSPPGGPPPSSGASATSIQTDAGVLLQTDSGIQINTDA